MTDILAECELLASTAAAQVPGMHQYPTLKDSPRAPGVVVVPANPFVDYEIRMGRARRAEYIFEIILLGGGRKNELAAQKTLFQWIDPAGPLIQALDDLDNTRVSNCSGIGVYPVSESLEYLGVTLQARVIA